MRTMAAGKFKATCLALLDEVETKRECVTVTKNGRPVAKMPARIKRMLRAMDQLMDFGERAESEGDVVLMRVLQKM